MVIHTTVCVLLFTMYSCPALIYLTVHWKACTLKRKFLSSNSCLLKVTTSHAPPAPLPTILTHLKKHPGPHTHLDVRVVLQDLHHLQQVNDALLPHAGLEV